MANDLQLPSDYQQFYQQMRDPNVRNALLDYIQQSKFMQPTNDMSKWKVVNDYGKNVTVTNPYGISPGLLAQAGNMEADPKGAEVQLKYLYDVINADRQEQEQKRKQQQAQEAILQRAAQQKLDERNQQLEKLNNDKLGDLRSMLEFGARTGYDMRTFAPYFNAYQQENQAKIKTILEHQAQEDRQGKYNTGMRLIQEAMRLPAGDQRNTLIGMGVNTLTAAGYKVSPDAVSMMKTKREFTPVQMDLGGQKKVYMINKDDPTQRYSIVEDVTVDPNVQAQIAARLRAVQAQIAARLRAVQAQIAARLRAAAMRERGRGGRASGANAAGNKGLTAAMNFDKAMNWVGSAGTKDEAISRLNLLNTTGTLDPYDDNLVRNAVTYILNEYDRKNGEGSALQRYMKGD